MEGDLLELMTYIGDLHGKQMTAINAVGKEFAEHKGNITARVETLEVEQKTAATRQWVHSIVVMPLLATIHGVAHHFGIKI